jgi:hypothetical protein
VLALIKNSSDPIPSIRYSLYSSSTVHAQRGNSPVSPDQEMHKQPTSAQPQTAHDATPARAGPNKRSGTAVGRQGAEQAVYEDRSPAAGVASHTSAGCLAVDIALYRSRRDSVAWTAAWEHRLGGRSSLRPWVGGGSSYRVFQGRVLGGLLVCGCCACSRFARRI